MKVEPEERIEEKKTVDDYGRIYVGRDRKDENLEMVLLEEEVDGELNVRPDDVLDKRVNDNGRVSVGREKAGDSFYVYILGTGVVGEDDAVQ